MEFLERLKAQRRPLEEYRKLGGDVRTTLRQEIEFCHLVCRRLARYLATPFVERAASEWMSPDERPLCKVVNL